MDIDKYTPIDLKKLFTKGTNINFLNDFTFQDVEDGKRRLFSQLAKEHDTTKLKSFLDEAGKKLMEEKFSNGFDKPIGAVIKNTVKDNLNPDYKNTIKRLINIDSQYIPLDCSIYDYVFKLTEKLVNVVSLELINLQIPVTFYNIEAKQGNNFFYINDIKIVIPDGRYELNGISPDTLMSIIFRIIVEQTDAFPEKIPDTIEFSIEPNNKKTIINITNPNTPVKPYTFTFSDETCKINNSLGWILGFRKFVLDASNNPTFTYINEFYDSGLSKPIISEKVAYINNTKNITISVDEFSHNQTSGSMVQTINEVNSIKPSSYLYDNRNYKKANLACITPDNLCEYEQNYNGGLTKAQLFSRAQVNQNKLLVNHQNNYLEPNTVNNVLAIVPFETINTTWGHKYFTDKNEYKRDYHGPVEIDKLQIKLYDDKGYLIDFNGISWSLTLITEHLYKY